MEKRGQSIGDAPLQLLVPRMRRHDLKEQLDPAHRRGLRRALWNLLYEFCQRRGRLRMPGTRSMGAISTSGTAG